MTSNVNASEALRLSVRNEVYVLVDGVERMIETGCFFGQAGVRMASLRLDDNTVINVPATDDVLVSRIVS
jgi:hypothetical protein